MAGGILECVPLRVSRCRVLRGDAADLMAVDGCPGLRPADVPCSAVLVGCGRGERRPSPPLNRPPLLARVSFRGRGRGMHMAAEKRTSPLVAPLLLFGTDVAGRRTRNKGSHRYAVIPEADRYSSGGLDYASGITVSDDG